MNKRFSLLLRFILIGVPISAVIITAFVVLFGDQGLLELNRTEEQLAALRIEVSHIQESNQDLEIQIRRLRSSPAQVEILTADELDKAADGTTIYRFHQ